MKESKDEKTVGEDADAGVEVIDLTESDAKRGEKAAGKKKAVEPDAGENLDEEEESCTAKSSKVPRDKKRRLKTTDNDATNETPRKKQACAHVDAKTCRPPGRWRVRYAVSFLVSCSRLLGVRTSRDLSP